MKLINKILILIIIIFLINHLSNGKILETFKNSFNNLKNKIEKFVGIQSNSAIISNSKPSNMELINPNELQEDYYLLYRFINNLVMPNINIYEIVNNKSKKLVADKNLVNEILTQINKMFNNNGFKFENIKLINPDKIIYYQIYRGKYIEMFYFSSDVSYLNKKIDSIIIGVGGFLRNDNFFSIVNVELGKINKINPFNNLKDTKSNNTNINYTQYQPNTEQHLTDNQLDAIITATQLSADLDDSFNNLVPIDNQNELFIKSNNLNQDDDDINIPSNIELSYEQPSETQQS